MKTPLFRKKLKTKRSQKLFLKASKLFPNTLRSPHGVSAFTQLYIKKASGAYVWDEDNNKYIDFTGCNGSMILGYANPALVKEVRKLATSGLCCGHPTKIEVRFAELIMRCMPSIEMLQFTSTPEAALSSSFALARSFTKRNKVVILGNLNERICTDVITSNDVLSVEYSIRAVRELFETHRDSIAAVFVSPLMPNGSLIPDSFVKDLHTLCHIHHALLIMDETLTGFRLSLGGVQALYSLQPDITILGGILGAGYPLAAYGGKRNIMESTISTTDPKKRMFHTPPAPYSLTVGYHTLRIISTNKMIYRHLEKRGEQLEEGLRELLTETGVPLTITRVGSIFSFVSNFAQQSSTHQGISTRENEYSEYSRFVLRCAQEGILLPSSPFEPCFLSTAHTEKILEKTIIKFARVLSSLE